MQDEYAQGVSVETRPFSGLASIVREQGNQAPADVLRSLPFGPGAGRIPRARGAFGVTGFGG